MRVAVGDSGLFCSCQNQQTREIISARKTCLLVFVEQQGLAVTYVQMDLTLKGSFSIKVFEFEFEFTQTQQQRPGLPTVTLTWHACNTRYINSTSGTSSFVGGHVTSWFVDAVNNSGSSLLHKVQISRRWACSFSCL